MIKNWGCWLERHYANFINEPVQQPKAPSESKKPTAKNKSRPWENENKESIKRKVFNIRINSYYHEALKHFSNPEVGDSMQVVARRILEEGLEQMIGEHEPQ